MSGGGPGFTVGKAEPVLHRLNKKKGCNLQDRPKKVTAFLKTDMSSKKMQRCDNDSPDGHRICFRNKKTLLCQFLKKETVVSDLMWFLSWYAHPGDGRGHVAMNIQQLPSITPGTPRKLYTALGAKQTDRC